VAPVVNQPIFNNTITRPRAGLGYGYGYPSYGRYGYGSGYSRYGYPGYGGYGYGYPGYGGYGFGGYGYGYPGYGYSRYGWGYPSSIYLSPTYNYYSLYGGTTGVVPALNASALLGIVVQPVFNGASNGLLVAQVSPYSPAERAGLRVGDTIVSANGYATQTIADLDQAVATTANGPLTLGVVSGLDGQLLMETVPFG
jgi:hypothetical protein